MSGGFEVGGEYFPATNGTTEAYLERFVADGAARLGADHPLVAAFRAELDGIFPGYIVSLDDHLAAGAERRDLLALVDAATEQLLATGAFTELGRRWVAEVIPLVRATLGAA